MQRVKTKKKKEWGSTSTAEVLSAEMDGKKCRTLVDAVQIDPASLHLATSAVTLFTLFYPHFRWFVFISCPDHMQVTPDARDIGQRVTLGRHAAPHTGAGNLKFGRGRVTQAPLEAKYSKWKGTASSLRSLTAMAVNQGEILWRACRIAVTFQSFAAESLLHSAKANQ